MALLATVRFELLLPDGGITAGHAANGILVVASDEAVPRASHIAIELVSSIPNVARVRPRGSSSGRSRGSSCPAAFDDTLVDITHAVRVRLDVAWAAILCSASAARTGAARRTAER